MSLTLKPDLSDWLRVRLSALTRTFEDECGSFYAYLEGGVGGETVLIWAGKSDAAEVLVALPESFKGRLVLGLDASPGYTVPFARALHWAAPRYAALVGAGEGIVSSFPGAKGLEGEGWAAWDDPRAAARLEVSVRPGFSYSETLAYPPWESPGLEGLRDNRPADLAGSRFRTGAAGGELGIPTYGAGLVGLGDSLRALLAAWKLV